MWTLALQDMEVIAVIRLWFGILTRMVAASAGLRDERPERARLLPLLGRPVKPSCLPGLLNRCCA